MSEGEVTKEVHYHPNGSAKIVWAWAGCTTAVLIAIIGAYAWQQHRSDEKMTEVLTNLAVQMGRMEAEIENLNRTIERYHRE